MRQAERVKILFLAANPAETVRLALDEEARAIEHKIRAAEHRDRFEFITQWAVRADDLLQALNQHRPEVVHFGGHGSDSGEILLTGRDGQAQPVSPRALETLFRTLRDDIRVVVLSACYSRPQAEAITSSIDCVVGVQGAIADHAAVAFAASFYRALAFGRSVQNAFDQGVTALALEGLDHGAVPSLHLREGVVADEMFLLAPAADPTPGPSSATGAAPAPVPITTQVGSAPTPTEGALIPTLPGRPLPPEQRERMLTELLGALFDGDPEGLRRWVHGLGKRLHAELPGGAVSAAQLGFDVALLLQRHGRVDGDMFAGLLALRPGHAGRIRQVAAGWGIAVSPPTPPRPDEAAVTTKSAPAPRVSQAVRDRLVGLIEACSSIRDAATRTMIGERLPQTLANKLLQSGSLHVQVSNLVAVCAEAPEGLTELRNAIQHFEGDSYPMRDLNEFLRTNALVSEPT
ncbi:effector-associated domain 2-containing protein [Haliangium sp.]|uniref:effector-associated domain 2-containing protein n=1 Tax=Haliangium sp. TaxID=2663208 RepID=UPI003D0CE822